jgi:hypothetical protein
MCSSGTSLGLSPAAHFRRFDSCVLDQMPSILVEQEHGSIERRSIRLTFWFSRLILALISGRRVSDRVCVPGHKCIQNEMYPAKIRTGLT